MTVDRKDGTIRNHPEASVTDLPGIYSLSPYTGEEIVSRQFILDENPDAIIDIIDATNIERNLYLTLQLMELDRPMVIALNMMDEVTANGGAVDVNLLESLLGVPVVPISAARNEGIGELVDHALHVARFRERPGRSGLLRARWSRRRCAASLHSRHRQPYRGPCRDGTHSRAFCGDQAS